MRAIYETKAGCRRFRSCNTGACSRGTEWSAASKRKWPIDLTGGARYSARRPTFTVDPKLLQTILDIERLLKDDELTSHALLGDELAYYEDGYPRLPECLDRRPEPLLAKAA